MEFIEILDPAVVVAEAFDIVFFDVIAVLNLNDYDTVFRIE